MKGTRRRTKSKGERKRRKGTRSRTRSKGGGRVRE